MKYEITLTGESREELKTILTLLAQGNIEAASAFEREAEQPKKPAAKAVGKDPAQKTKAPVEAAAAPSEKPKAEPKPDTTAETAPWDDSAPTPEAKPAEQPAAAPAGVMALAPLQELGRSIIAADRSNGKKVQAIVREYGVLQLSAVPADKRAEVYARLKEIEV